MTDETNKTNHGHGDFERSDIGVAGVIYFLIGLAIFGLFAHLIATGLFHVLDKQSEAQQPAVSPLVSSTPADTRHLPEKYTGPGGYEQYLKDNFPTPQLETDERRQLDDIRTQEEETLHTYGYVDQKAGTVRIPIDRAMELVAQRGLPVRAQADAGSPQDKKGSKQ